MQKLCAELTAAGRVRRTPPAAVPSRPAPRHPPAARARGPQEVRPEQYLFLFLKFISAVCPTIEYDYTLSVDGL